ncbi:helix-turn-helix domain-containing protein [Streptomyces scopuliridis]|uniref:helix-turn-helix domain-containing protein n=1 Tax=Streptomyces scopuliridis TaxID=452529 RepID=UPI0036CEAE6A
MGDPTGPTVRRRRLGGELRTLRELLGLDQAAAAKHLECSTSKISRLETGQGIAKLMEIKSLLDLYKVDDPAARTKILEIHKAASQQGWWEQPQYETVLPSGLGVYVGLEYDARALRTWELGYVPGLLQTEAYARAVLSSGVRPADEVERLVDVRRQRQQRLTATTSQPLELWAIIDETALLRPVGGKATMREQIHHMVQAAALPNVTLQVYPLNKTAHPGMKGAFTLLDFEAAEPVIGYVDSHAGNVFLERDKQTRALAHTFDRLRAGALDPDASVARLNDRATEESKP